MSAKTQFFIGGDDRSGTTLLSLMFDSHRDIAAGPEIDFTEPTDLGSSVIACCDLLIKNDPRVHGDGVATANPAFHLPVQFAKQCLRYGVTYECLQELVRECMGQTHGNLVNFRDRCTLLDAIGDARLRATGKTVWAIKIQSRLGEAHRFSEIWSTAKFIHMVRDGRDVAASQLRGNRGWGYTTIEEAAHGWAGLMEAIHSSSSREQILDVRYEDLVSSPVATMQRLLTFLNVPWDEGVLQHQTQDHTLLKHPFRHPSAEAVRRPVNSEAVGRYIKDLSGEERRRFEEIAARWLEEYGYI
ncbi:MAG TPA: sulfotransferase [Edaphobacter sp.]|uniref:sulfotransferase family protein n=1 Tax=Edaphobacter sp. TaxID=1934404 RepID=UPI002BB5E4D7|nr:sulfotransferase [Edaphobacter sp.]HUZ93811.1 sulfotransferase [Edaphobacter sp.]